MSKGLTACIVKSVRMNSGTEMDRMTAEQKSIKTCRCGALGSVMTAAEGARVPPGPGIVGEAARKPVSIGERWFQLEPQREGNHGEVSDVGGHAGDGCEFQRACWKCLGSWEALEEGCEA